MAHYRASVDSPLGADDAFALLADFSNAADWDPGVRSARRLGEGPIQVGSTFEVVASFLGRDVPLTYRITQLDAPNRVVFEADARGLRSVDTITFEKRGDGTRVTYDANLTLSGLAYVFDLPLHLAFQWIGGRALAGLAKALRA